MTSPQIPDTQTALLISGASQPFTVSSRPVPTPGPGQVLIKVHAAALNPIDALIQKGHFPMAVWPTVVGSDGAGEVLKLGEGADKEGRMKVGDRV